MKEFIKFFFPLIIAYVAGMLFKDIGFWSNIVLLPAIIIQLWATQEW